MVSFDDPDRHPGRGDPPGATCDRLVALARRAGAPDNVTCIVADVVDEPATADAAPAVVGAASVHPQRESTEDEVLTRRARRRAHRPPRRRGRRTATTCSPGRAAAAPCGSPASPWSPPARRGGLAAWHWVRQQYFVGVYDDQVAVFRGLPQDLGPIVLSSLDHTTGVMVSALPPADRDSVRAGLVVDSSAKAAEKVEALRQAAACASMPTVDPDARPSRRRLRRPPAPRPVWRAGPTATTRPDRRPDARPRPAGSATATGTGDRDRDRTLTPSATSVSGGDRAAACAGSQ